MYGFWCVLAMIVVAGNENDSLTLETASSYT